MRVNLKSLPVILLAMLPFLGMAQQQHYNLLKKLAATPADTTRLLAYKEVIKLNLNNYTDTAFKYATQGLAEATRQNNSTYIAFMNSMLGVVHNNLGKFNEARNYFKIAEKLFEKENDQTMLAGVYSGLAVTYGRQGNYQMCMQQLVKAFNIYKAANDSRGLMNTYLKMGVANGQNNEFKKALYYYAEAQKINNTLTAGETNYTLYNNIGIIYARQGEYDKALTYFKEGLEKAEKTQLWDVRVLLLTNGANVYQHKRDFNKALFYNKRALDIAREKKMPVQEGTVLVNIASVYHDMGKKEEAYRLIHQAINLTVSTQNNNVALEAYSTLISMAQDDKDWQTAFNTTMEMHHLSDSLAGMSNKAEIDALVAENKLEIKDLRIKEAEAEAIIRESERNFIIIVAVLAIIVLIVLIFFYLRIRQYNLRLNKQKTELEGLNYFKDKLFSIIAHDLRGPISSMIMVLPVLQEDDLTAEDKTEVLNNLEEQSQRTLETLDQLLVWGSSQLKGVDVYPVNFDASQVIEKNINLLQMAAAAKNIKVENLAETGNFINADLSHFDFVIRNLLANAIKFTPDGGSVKVEARTPNHNLVTFSIADTGTGMDSDTLNTLFKPLTKSKPGTNKEKGTGLGLMLTKEFTVKNGGDISVESQPGKGSTFNVNFKRAGGVN